MRRACEHQGIVADQLSVTMSSRSGHNPTFLGLGAFATVLLAVMLTSCAMVAGPTSHYDRAPKPAPSVPTPGPTGPGVSGAGSGTDPAIVKGHVLTSDGRAVAGADIVFWVTTFADCPHCGRHVKVETGPDGSYTIFLQDGGYLADCEATAPCGAEGSSGGDVAFDVPPGHTLNFIVCSSSAEIPECLHL